MINQLAAVAMLTKAGYQVDAVRNGAQAVRAAGDMHYDAILMDCQMPQMDGYEATTAIRLEEAHDRHTPIIALTLAADDEDRSRWLEAGMDDCLAKPLREGPLVTMVRECVRTR